MAADVKKRGIKQPILVTADGMIIAGERRWRAAKIAKLEEVPVIFEDINDDEVQELALIENLQRENLTSIEEGQAYKQLLELYKCTQKELAQKLHVTESSVTERLKLLTLPKKAQQSVIEGKISFSHAKALFGLSNTDTEELLQEIIEKGSNVKETKKKAAEKKDKQPPDTNQFVRDIKKDITKAKTHLDNALVLLPFAADGYEEPDLLNEARGLTDNAYNKLEEFLKGK